MDEDFDIPAAADMMNDDLDLPDETPIMKVGEEKEIGKQGLKKKLLKEGEGWEKPESGDEVEGIYYPINKEVKIKNIIEKNLFWILIACCCCSSLYGNVAGWNSVRFQP